MIRHRPLWRPLPGSLLACAILASGAARAAVAFAHPASAHVAARFEIARDFSLHFTHRLGAAEAERRIKARVEDLRHRFANVASSTETWSDHVLDMRVSAFGQAADAHLVAKDTGVDLSVHLPLLLAPLGGNIKAFLETTGEETLR